MEEEIEQQACLRACTCYKVLEVYGPEAYSHDFFTTGTQHLFLS